VENLETVTTTGKGVRGKAEVKLGRSMTVRINTF